LKLFLGGKRMNITESFVQYRIDIDFEDCDVDMVYKEMRARGVTTSVPTILTGSDNHECIGNKTPIEGTVDFCLNWLSGYVNRDDMRIQERFRWNDESNKTELEILGIKVVSTYGLMMGGCHLICEVDSDKYSKELVNKSIVVINSIFKKYVKYHNN
jgi:hypothetical protein